MSSHRLLHSLSTLFEKKPKRKSVTKSTVILSKTAEQALVLCDNITELDRLNANIVIAMSGERVRKTCSQYKNTGSLCIYCVKYAGGSIFREDVDMLSRIYEYFDRVLILVSFCSSIFYENVNREFLNVLPEYHDRFKMITWRQRIPTNKEKNDTIKAIDKLISVVVVVS